MCLLCEVKRMRLIGGTETAIERIKNYDVA